MIEDLMHARIDLRKYVILTKYGNCYQLENSSERMDRWNAPEISPIEAPWPLD